MSANKLGPLWQEIAADPHSTGTVARRLLPQLKHDIFIGEHRNPRRRFAQFTLFGPAGDVPKADPSTRGISVRVAMESPVKTTIEISETTNSLAHQFDQLLEDLLELIEQQPGDGTVARISRRLLAWKEFFARQGTLSAEQAAGLFAELSVLSGFVLPAVGPGAAIDAWTGPNPASQDFQLTRGAVEVKSWRGTGPGTLKITSERQLERTEGIELVVAYVTLEEREAGPGPTLAELISVVDQSLSSEPTAQVAYRDKLLRVGWSHANGEAHTDHYIVRRLEYLHVTEDFPRITRSLLPTGIGRVSYELDRSVLQPFVIPATDAAVLTGITT